MSVSLDCGEAAPEVGIAIAGEIMGATSEAIRHRDALTTVPTGYMLFMTGRPGVGKTTGIRSIIASLVGWQLVGSCTEEIRVAGGARAFAP